MIDKNSPVPIYYQLEEEIRYLIQSEQLKSGDLLPSERELAEKYDISRMTIRQATNNLVMQGLINREKGKGTFVSEKKFEQDLSGLTSFNEDMSQYGRKPSNTLIGIRAFTDDTIVASTLNVSSKDEIYEIKRIRMADNEPIALETVFTPREIVGNLNYEDVTTSFYDFLEQKLQLKIAYGNQTIESSLANEEEIKYLNIKKGDPILLMQRISFLKDEEETPVEYVKSAYRADKYKFKMRMKRK